MALKPSRRVEAVDYYFYDGKPTERGVILTVNKKQNYPGHVCVSCNQSAVLEPVGLLLVDVVDLNTTTSFYVDSVRPGNRISVLKKGWVITNKVVTKPNNIKIGAEAILYPNGYIGPWLWGGKSCKKTKKVGRFESGPDKDGYVRVYIDI